jgi:transposase InsO family protein
LRINSDSDRSRNNSDSDRSRNNSNGDISRVVKSLKLYQSFASQSPGTHLLPTPVTIAWNTSSANASNNRLAHILCQHGQSSDGIWDALIDIWCSIHTGYPDRLRIDSGSAFTSVKRKTLTESRGITLRISGVEAHNSLGIGERYHGSLRRLYQKIEHEFPHVGPALLLRIAVKAINDTMGTNGLVPPLLVFDVVPRFSPMSIDLPKQGDRIAAVAAAQMEMSAIVSENRVNAALTHDVPSSVDRTYEVGEEVLVFREKKNGRGRWWWYSWKTRL